MMKLTYLFWVMTQCNIVGTIQHSAISFQSHPEAWWNKDFVSSILRMGLKGYPRMLYLSYNIMSHHTPKEHLFPSCKWKVKVIFCCVIDSVLYFWTDHCFRSNDFACKWRFRIMTVPWEGLNRHGPASILCWWIFLHHLYPNTTSESALGLANFWKMQGYSLHQILGTFHTYLPVSVYLNCVSQ